MMISSVSSGFSTMGYSRIGGGPSGGQDDLFSKIDSSGDGALDETELGTFAEKMGNQSSDAAKMLSQFDTDGDGAVSESEFAAGRPQGPPPSMGGAKGNEKDPFSDIDTDSDGSLSESELTTFADTMSEMTGETQDVSALMDKLDTDGSGTISSDEFKAGKPEGPPPGGMPPGGMAGNGMQDLFQTSDSSSSSTTDLFSSMDTDGDGNVSGDEFKVGIENLVNTFLNQTYSASSSTSGSVLSLEA